MTIGKNSRKSSVRSSIRAPKFLDKSGGFYGRLDEPESAGEVRGEETVGGVADDPTHPNAMDVPGAGEPEEAEVCDYSEGMMEDDGKTLLQRQPSRRSSRWRRSSRRKQKAEPGVEDAESSGEDTRAALQAELEKLKRMEEEKEKAGRGNEAALDHFPVREDDDDDQVLIGGREEEAAKGEEERGMKMVKRSTMKNYRKALDRALRRGWAAFVTNLYSVTLTPVASPTPSPSPSPQKKLHHNSVLAEFQ